MKKFEKELSIIIVNYNGEKYLKDCLESVYKNCSSIDFEVVIIDNKSSDDSILFIKKNYPEITLIESEENLGFAKGNNKAVAQSVGEYLLLLNNDTILIDDISPALNCIVKDDTVGVVGIKMLDAHKKYVLSVGNFPSPFSLIKFSFFQKKEGPFMTGKFNDKKNIVVDWVTGSFLVTKRNYWDKVGGLDEDYFMYVEDVDFCKKIKKCNKKSVFIPTVSYIHYIGFNKRREERLIKGYRIYASKHFNFINSLIAKLCLTINYAYKKITKSIR
ncbi:MAG: glycosyltransferase family 2 protein [Polaribacter sp.]|nr:glycosyltransferase family 2 protein [Polaribacter sp.]